MKQSQQNTNVSLLKISLKHFKKNTSNLSNKVVTVLHIRRDLKELNRDLEIEIESEIEDDNISNIMALEEMTNSSKETRELI